MRPTPDDGRAVPDGWALMPLRRLCDILSGGTPPKTIPAFWKGDIPWVSGKDLKSPRLADAKDHLSPDGLVAGSRLAPKDAVLLLVRGMGLAKDLPVAVIKCPMAFNQDIKALVPRTELSGSFLRAAIYHSRARLLSRIVPSAHGTMTLNLDDVEAFEVHVPLDPREGNEVARVVDLILDAIDHASQQCATAQGLKCTAMRALFTRGLRGEAQKETEIGPVPKSWDVIPLGSLGRIGNGSTPKKNVPEYWKDGDFPWLTSAKVYDRNIVEADHFVTATALRECHLPQIEPGAILIAITGQGKTLGHCAVLRMRATANQHIAYIATDLERAEPSFVRGYLETQYDYFRQVGAGGGSTKGALTCAFLRSVPIPFPPTLDEQREIVTVLDAIDRKIDIHRRKRAVLNNLFKALLHKLMTGEIRVADLDLSALAPGEMVEAAE